MNCPVCGASTRENAYFCDRCGTQIGNPPFAPRQPQLSQKKDNKLLWIVVIVVILAVVLPTVLAAALYFMVLGFGGTSDGTPVTQLSRTSVAYGAKFTFAPTSREVSWSDVSIILGDMNNSCLWTPATAFLVGSGEMLWDGGFQPLGAMRVFCNVTDLDGNGRINQGDYFTLVTGGALSFSASSIYTVTVMHKPTSYPMCDTYFTG